MVAPHRIEQLLLGDDSVTVLDQMRQHIEHLRLDVHRFTVALQLEAGGVEQGILEGVLHALIMAGANRSCPVRPPRNLHGASKASGAG